MKNIQVIDGALNCAYDIYSATEEEFRLIFPEEEQDIQFAEDLPDTTEISKALENIWNKPLDKKFVNGIHGTLFYGLTFKKEFYPRKKESDLTENGSRPN